MVFGISDNFINEIFVFVKWPFQFGQRKKSKKIEKIKIMRRMGRDFEWCYWRYAAIFLKGEKGVEILVF